MSSRSPSGPPGHSRPAVLLIEDDVPLARGLTRLLSSEGYEVVHVASGGAALGAAMSRSFDVVLSDINLREVSGVDVLTVVRAQDPDVPMILMTGHPTADSVIAGRRLGVLDYLVKPTPRDTLLRVLERAVSISRAKSARQNEKAGDASTPSNVAASQVGPASPAKATAPAVAAVSAAAAAAAAAAVEGRLEPAAAALDPIVSARDGALFGFAQQVVAVPTRESPVGGGGRIEDPHVLRRRARDRAVEAFAAAPPDALLFVEAHPSDLANRSLTSEPALAKIAGRVVLQVSARGLRSEELKESARTVRLAGFRLALTGIDAGHDGLAQIAEVEPEYVKLEARVIADVGGSPGRRRLVRALVAACRALDAVPIAEGVSTVGQSDILLNALCELVQGPHVRRQLAR